MPSSVQIPPPGMAELPSKTAMSCCLKFLAPEVMASAIIGKGGANIRKMRETIDAKIELSSQTETYPGTDSRILTVQAHNEDALNEVTRQIIYKMGELMQTSPNEALGKDEDRLLLRTVVPRPSVGGIIGKGGAAITSLREESGAKIAINEAGHGTEQFVAITGTESALEFVMLEVNKQIQALNEEPWFQEWANIPASAICSTPGGKSGYGAKNAQAHDSQGGGYGGGGAARGGSSSNSSWNPGIDVMMSVANGLPPYVTEDARGFAVSCVVPNRLVGGLIGRGGAGTKEVQHTTGTKIGIREIPNDPENRSMSIAGPLTNTCAAYMLMMKRYLDAEAFAAEDESGGGGVGGGGGGGGRRKEKGAGEGEKGGKGGKGGKKGKKKGGEKGGDAEEGSHHRSKGKGGSWWHPVQQEVQLQ